MRGAATNWKRTLPIRGLKKQQHVILLGNKGLLRSGAELGARRATLEVRRSNEAARLLYERFGFSVGGVRPAYYSKPVEDALILWREDLPPPDRRP